MNMKLFKLGGNVFNTYRTTVKGNENISKPQARRKLTRNIMLAVKRYNKIEGLDYYMYGCLHMIVKGDTIVWIKNRCSVPPMWFKDIDKYNELNVLLGIITDQDKQSENVG